MKKKQRATDLTSAKAEALYVELYKKAEGATSSYSVTTNLLQYIYSVHGAKNHQNIRSRRLIHEFSFTDNFQLPFYMAVAIYCYYEKVRRTMCTDIVLASLKYIGINQCCSLCNLNRVRTTFMSKIFLLTGRYIKIP